MLLMNPGPKTSNYWLARNLYEQPVSLPFDDVHADFALPIHLIMWFVRYLNIPPTNNCRGIANNDV